MQDSAVPTYATHPQSVTTSHPVTSTTSSHSFQDYLMKNKKIVMIIGVLLIGLFLLNSPLLSQTRVITTIGTSKVTFEPGKVTITLLYANTNRDPNVLVAESEQEFSALKSELQAMGQMELANVTPQIAPSSTGYQLTQGLRITFTDINLLSQINQYLRDKKVAIVETRFYPKDETKVNEELMDKAMADARAKASAIAKANNNRLGRVLGVAEASGTSANTGTAVTVNSVTSQSSEDVPANQAELTSTINVTYSLKGFLF